MQKAWFRALSGAAVIVIGVGTQTAWAAPGGAGNGGGQPAGAGHGNADPGAHGNAPGDGRGGPPAEPGPGGAPGEPHGNGHGRPDGGEQPAARGNADAGDPNGNGHGRPDGGEQPAARGNGNAPHTPAANGNSGTPNRGNSGPAGRRTSPGAGSNAGKGQAPAGRGNADAPGNGSNAAGPGGVVDGADGNGIGGQTPHDPPGNNGTIHMHEPGDSGPGNTPHMSGCSVQLDGYGFDSNQTLDVSFSLHAPTGSGVVLTDQLTADGDGNGNDGTRLDATKVYDLSSALTTSGFEPHPKQGYHVRVTVDGKHKMVWLPCSPAPQPLSLRSAAGLVAPAAVTPASVSPTLLPAPLEPQLLRADGWTAVVSVPDSPAVLAAGGVVPGTTRVLGAVFERPDGERPRVLAFTGSGLFPAVTVATLFLLTGLALVGAARRRRGGVTV